LAVEGFGFDRRGVLLFLGRESGVSRGTTAQASIPIEAMRERWLKAGIVASATVGWYVNVEFESFPFDFVVPFDFACWRQG
jgi:hypothetical protein